MNIQELKELVISTTNATPVRPSKSSFYAVELEDGTYAKITISALNKKDVARKDGKIVPAFNFNAAVKNYETYTAEQQAKAEERAAARAAKPKQSYADPEKVALRAARQAKLWKYLQGKVDVELTSREIATDMPDVYADNDVMAVGVDLKALASGHNELICEKREGKKYWTYRG